MVQRSPGPDETGAYVWAWLPGATEPVVAGALRATGGRVAGETVWGFGYARSYRERGDAVSLFRPELPLVAGLIDPTSPPRAVDERVTGWAGYPPVRDRSALPIAGCLRDAAPDAWGRRVVNARLAADPEAQLTEITYLLHSSSDRIGALDFQTSPEDYVPRGGSASLDQLVRAAELVEAGVALPDDLWAAAGHGTSIGGARPKALVDDGDRRWVAKFASSTDDRPVVKAEAVGMLLAARVGIDVAPVEVVEAGGRDVLLVERFDRGPDGARRAMVSALTILGLREEEARYASYADLARAIRHPGWAGAADQLQELYRRMVFNIAIGNTDDHLRNHAAFWDGRELRLTPAYDLAPQRRSTGVASHAIALTAPSAPGAYDGQRASQFRVARDAASSFLIREADAAAIIDHVVTAVRDGWDEACHEARLTSAEADQLWGREILNAYAFYDEA